MKTGRPSTRLRPPFGERLYQLREMAGLTQAQVATKLKITHRAYAFWERVPTAIRPEQMTILADLFGVSGDYLLGREPVKQRGVGPTGKLRQLFETASDLPRRQQQHIATVIADLLIARGANGHRMHHSNGHAKAA